MAEAQLPDGDPSPQTSAPRRSLPPPADAADLVGGVRRERRRFPIFGYRDFIRGIESNRLSAARLGRFIGESQTREFTHIWGTEVEMS